MKTSIRALAAVTAAMLLVTACGDEPDEGGEATPTATAPEPTDEATEAESPTEEDSPTEAAQAADFRGCMVTDEGGVDDNSFNETSFEGLEMAADEFGIETAVLESNSPSDFVPNIQQFLDQDCDIIVTVGFALAEATAEAAENNPDQLFAIVDFDFFDSDAGEDITYDNVKELTFQTDQAAFLAGYVAAATTETGTIGTYGGRPFPTVTIFMDGYLAGARYYNQNADGSVDVLGWEGNPDTGLFTGDFTDQSKGRQLTDQLLSNGADTVMPVAGPVGLGTAAAIEEAGTGRMIWVDTDGCESTDFCPLILTSVMKNMDQAVFDAIASAVNDAFEGGLYVGTLENEGVQIAPFHEFEDAVPQDVKDTLDELRQGIIDGSISVAPADYESSG